MYGLIASTLKRSWQHHLQRSKDPKTGKSIFQSWVSSKSGKCPSLVTSLVSGQFITRQHGHKQPFALTHHLEFPFHRTCIMMDAFWKDGGQKNSENPKRTNADDRRTRTQKDLRRPLGIEFMTFQLASISFDCFVGLFLKMCLNFFSTLKLAWLQKSSVKVSECCTATA